MIYKLLIVKLLLTFTCLCDVRYRHTLVFVLEHTFLVCPLAEELGVRYPSNCGFAVDNAVDISI